MGAPSSLDLVGHWNGTIEFGKFTFRMLIKIAPDADGKRVKVTMDNPEQGMRDMPVNALLYNPPFVRFEIDAFNTAFNGALNADASAINGEFEEGPGGRAIKVGFVRKAPNAEPVGTFEISGQEARDHRGYWKGHLELQPGQVMPVGLRIARYPDGSFRGFFDSFEQGALDVPSPQVHATNGVLQLSWYQSRVTFDARLDDKGDALSGEWSQNKRPLAARFSRLAAPATALPPGVSFRPEGAAGRDPRGEWKGVIEIPGGPKLRLVFKLGRLPDGTLTGMLHSPDQGSAELLLSSASFTNSTVRLETRAIRGTYNGTLNDAGTELDGKWEQFGNPLPLKLSRKPAADDAQRR